MKKTILILMAVLLSFAFVSCEGVKTAFYTVSFVSNGGSNIESQSVIAGTKAVKPEAPKKLGFVFENWYLDEECEGDAFNFKTAINGDITLYAKWGKLKVSNMPLEIYSEQILPLLCLARDMTQLYDDNYGNGPGEWEYDDLSDKFDAELKEYFCWYMDNFNRYKSLVPNVTPEDYLCSPSYFDYSGCNLQVTGSSSIIYESETKESGNERKYRGFTVNAVYSGDLPYVPVSSVDPDDPETVTTMPDFRLEVECQYEYGWEENSEGYCLYEFCKVTGFKINGIEFPDIFIEMSELENTKVIDFGDYQYSGMYFL